MSGSPSIRVLPLRDYVPIQLGTSIVSARIWRVGTFFGLA